MFVGCALIVASTAAATAADAKRVLFLHSFGPLFKPWSDYARTIRAEMSRQSKWSIDFTDVSLVTARSNTEDRDPPLVRYLQDLYARHPADLIIAVGAPAARFVQRNRGVLFPQTPMIFTAVDKRRVDESKLSENDTLVAVTHDFALAFRTILHVLPDTKTIVVVNGASSNEAFWHNEIVREAEPLKDRVKLRWYDDLPFDEILKEVANLPPHTAIFWHLMNVDAAGIAHEENASLNALAAVSSAPVFSYDDSFFEGAIVGGSMFSSQEGSAITAQVAERILSGEKAGDIKTPPIPFAAPRFDWRQMQRWSISENSLPAGSRVYFRSPTLWESYRWQILFVCAVILTQTFMIGRFLLERHRRRFAESEARQRMVELAHANRYSMAGEMTATIAHEINQPLGAILNNAEYAKSVIRSRSPNLEELDTILADICRDDERASEVIKRLHALFKKAPMQAKSIDLNNPVKEAMQLLSPVMEQQKISLHPKLAAVPLVVKADAIHIQQVVLNLLRNSSDAISERSTQRRSITVSTHRSGETAELRVSDTAGGIHPAENLERIFDPFFSTKTQGMGMGLSIVRTIISTHGGAVSAENGQQGAIFRVTLPTIAN